MQVYSIVNVLNDEAMIGKTLSIQGWVRTRRDSKAGISFLNVYDGSCFDAIQVVVPNTLDNYQSDVLHLTAGCSVIITGEVVASPGKGQSAEIQAISVELVGGVEDPETYPISPKRHTLEYLREYAHLRPRTNIMGAVARIRHCVSQGLHRTLDKNGFYWVHTPIITASDCEGAGELFRVSHLDLLNLPKTDKGDIDFSQDFFGRESYLTVSGQLNVESYCCAMSKVYTFGPTFRAENSNTSRHLAEFWMVEPEMAFTDLQGISDLAESLLKDVVGILLEERQDDLAFFTKWVDDKCLDRLQHISDSEFVRMDYSEAIDILKSTKKKFEFPVSWGLDLKSEHERYLAEEHVGRPVIVMNYPKEIKAFYMRLNDDEKTVAAMDVLAPGIGEIIGGSQREERLEILDVRMIEAGLEPNDLYWYRDLRRYGSVPHAGFGLGLERFISYVTGVANVRDVIPFPRTPNNAEY